MANSTRYYQLTKNILLEYVYVDTESYLTNNSTERIIDLKNKNKLYITNNKFNGKIIINTFCKDNKFYFKIKDNGCGIDIFLTPR